MKYISLIIIVAVIVLQLIHPQPFIHASGWQHTVLIVLPFALLAAWWLLIWKRVHLGSHK